MASELEMLIIEKYGSRCPEFDADCPCCQIWAEYVTRAVPDVPELVRYRIQLLSIDGFRYTITASTHQEGEYVRHDQAEAVIAAKDVALDGLSGAVEECNAEIEELSVENVALKNKLAQIEKPIGYVSKSFFESLKIDRFHSIAAYVLRESSERYSDPLYTAPVASDADLRAENERLRGIVRDCLKELDRSRRPSYAWQLKAVAALNPSEPRT